MKNSVILINRFGMGEADPELQLKLIVTYLNLLNEDHSLRPNAICFYADGVKLAVDGSPALEALKALEANGVRLILCSTCLNFFKLTDSVRVGIVGGMTDIIEAQRLAEKVITL